MEATEALFTRRSIRKFKPVPVPDDQLNTILKAGMYAPSARNEQPWHFIVTNKEDLKEKLMKAHPYASMLSEAPLAILVCADTDLELSTGYWPIDCAAATQNILLAAHANGIGSVWLGVHPRRERKDAIRNIFDLPGNIEPFALIALGYPAEEKEKPERFKENRIHINEW
ncbi:MAG: nitroreductase family protein [Bacteroidales bacterium]